MAEGLALIVGSAPRAVEIQRLPLAERRPLGVVGVNNAWRLSEAYTHVIYPGDFPEDRRCPHDSPPVHVSVSDYMPPINLAGGLLYCGATMALAAGYWAVTDLEPAVLGFLGCDMVYGAGQTHFYGVGAPDPLRDDISLRDLPARTTRLFAWALKRGSLLLNLTGEKGSNLTWPVTSFDVAEALAKNGARRLPEAWSLLLHCSEDLFALEREAPFDWRNEEYWKLQGVQEAERSIAQMNERWSSLAPLIEEGWRGYFTEEL